MKIRQIIIKEVQIEATELTLLTKEEYLVAKQRIKPIKTQIWWLRPSNDEENPHVVVASEDKVIEITWKFDVSCAVRPALRFDTSCTGLNIGDTFMFGDNTWTVILEGLALCDDVFEMMEYHKYCGPSERWGTPEAWRNYEKSDIKEYLDWVFRGWTTTE